MFPVAVAWRCVKELVGPDDPRPRASSARATSCSSSRGWRPSFSSSFSCRDISALAGASAIWQVGGLRLAGPAVRRDRPSLAHRRPDRGPTHFAVRPHPARLHRDGRRRPVARAGAGMVDAVAARSLDFRLVVDVALRQPAGDRAAAGAGGGAKRRLDRRRERDERVGRGGARRPDRRLRGAAPPRRTPAAPGAPPRRTRRRQALPRALQRHRRSRHAPRRRRRRDIGERRRGGAVRPDRRQPHRPRLLQPHPRRRPSGVPAHDRDGDPPRRNDDRDGAASHWRGGEPGRRPRRAGLRLGGNPRPSLRSGRERPRARRPRRRDVGGAQRHRRQDRRAEARGGARRSRARQFLEGSPAGQRQP